MPETSIGAKIGNVFSENSLFGSYAERREVESPTVSTACGGNGTTFGMHVSRYQVADISVLLRLATGAPGAQSVDAGVSEDSPGRTRALQVLNPYLWPRRDPPHAIGDFILNRCPPCPTWAAE